MIAKLIEELQTLERSRERELNNPMVYVNVPNGDSKLSVSLQITHTQGKCVSINHALLLLIQAFRDGKMESLCGRFSPRSESTLHAKTKDLDDRIKYIQETEDLATVKMLEEMIKETPQ